MIVLDKNEIEKVSLNFFFLDELEIYPKTRNEGRLSCVEDKTKFEYHVSKIEIVIRR